MKSTLPTRLEPLPLCLGIFAIAVCVFIVGTARAQDQPADTQPPAAGDELSVEQGRLADRFKRLEEVVGRLAELSDSTDPRRARLLREAIAKSREQDINVRFEAIVKLLEDERLSAAATNQTELQQELEGLLTLLLKADRDKELASQRERVRKYLKEVARLIRLQKGIRARTEGGDELPQLSEDQQSVAGDTGKLGGDIAETEGDKEGDQEPADGESADAREASDGESSDQAKPGESSKPGESESGKSSNGKSSNGEPSESEPGEGKPSEGTPSQPQQGGSGSPSQGGGSESEQEPSESQNPADRATERLRAAQQQMEEARKKLDEAQREGAADRQREALKKLEEAKAELERVLRQLREEELDRMLTQLAARFRKMLELQNAVYEGTVRLASSLSPPEVGEGLAQPDHDDEIEAARLSRQEAEIVREADKALLLLREDGTSVAFPEAVEQMRDDMQQVVERLAAVKVDEITQGLERDILTALEELIAALEKAIEDLEKNRTPPGQAPPAGQPAEPRLVHKLAELKMIRSLQVRIYQRTQRYGQMIEGEQAETAELLEALRELAARQRRVHKATADLEEGQND